MTFRLYLNKHVCNFVGVEILGETPLPLYCLTVIWLSLFVAIDRDLDEGDGHLKSCPSLSWFLAFGHAGHVYHLVTVDSLVAFDILVPTRGTLSYYGKGSASPRARTRATSTQKDYRK
jgi:hypothetical protein